MAESVLTRFSESSLNVSNLTNAQSAVDGMVSHFAEEAGNWRNLAAMATGSLFYRVGRIGTLALASRAGQAAPLFQVASYGIGLGTEVVAFEGSSRLLASAVGDRSNANLWRWSGQGGWGQGLASSLVTFGMLKGAGHAAQGQNVVLQHLFSDFAMVGGHQAAYALGLNPRPEGTFAEQMLHAEVTNLQLGAGMALLHSAAPGLVSLERGLDLSLRANETLPNADARPLRPLLSFAEAAATTGEAGARAEERIPFDPRNNIAAMSILDGEGDSPSAPGRSRSLPSFEVEPSEPIAPLVKPEPPLAPFSTTEPVPAVRSSLEGVDRARVLGADRRQLAYLRWAMGELQTTTETTRQQFLTLMRRVFEANERLRPLLDPVLSQIPEADYRDLNERARAYQQALRELAPGGVQSLGEAVLLLEGTRHLRSYQDFSKAGAEALDSLMRGLGVEPDTILSIERNPRAFEREVLFEILLQPSMSDLPETRPLLEAIGRPDAKNEEIAAAFSTFLSDPVRARVFRLESAKQAALVRALQEIPGNFLVDWVRRHDGDFSRDDRPAMKEFLDAADDLATQPEPGALGKLWNRAQQLAGREVDTLSTAQGRYEKAFFDLIRRLSLSQKESIVEDASLTPLIERTALSDALRASESYFNAERELTERLRETFRALEPANLRLWREVDEILYGKKKQTGLLEADLELQLSQARDELQRAIDRVGPASFERRPYVQEFLEKARKRNEDAKGLVTEGPLLDRLQTFSSQKVQRFPRVVQRGDVPSLMANGLLREAIQEVAHLRRLAHTALAAEGLSHEDFTVISPLMAPVSEKMDTKNGTHLYHSVRAATPHIRHTLLAAKAAVDSQKRGESSAVPDRTFLQQSASVQRGTSSQYVVDPNVDAIVEQSPLVQDASHSSWQGDFFDGSIPGTRAAQLKGRHTHRDALRILAKADLGEKIKQNPVGQILADAIGVFTEPVGSTPEEYDRAITEAARSMAYGHLPGHRPGPRSAGVFSELTMPLFSMLTPFAFDPFPPSTGMMTPPLGGRSFAITDRAMALTGRRTFSLLSNALGGYVLDPPKPDRFLPRRQISLNTVTELWPTWSLIEANRSPDDKKETSQGQWLRTLWWRQALTPEHAPAIPYIDARFKNFLTPVDISVERTLEAQLGGALGVYPSTEGAQSARQRVEALESVAAGREGDAEFQRTLTNARRALNIYETRVVETRLQRAQLEIEETRKLVQDSRECDALSRTLGRRLKRLEQIAGALSQGKELSENDRREWRALQDSVAQHPIHPQANAILEGMNRANGALNGPLPSIPAPLLESARRLVKERIVQARLAFARQTLGERLSPTEELLISNLAGTLAPSSTAAFDPLFGALLGPASDLTADTLQNLLTEEGIREHTRELIRRLPGAGRGILDSVEENAQTSQSDAAPQGRRSHLATAGIAALFTGQALGLGSLDSIGNALSGGRLPFYGKVSPGIARSLLSTSRWRPVLTPEDLRTLENARLLAHREGRPVVIFWNPLSGIDNTILMSVFPEGKTGRETNRARSGTFIPIQDEISQTGSVATLNDRVFRNVGENNALVLVATLQGSDQITPDGVAGVAEGSGVDRRVYLRFDLLDPQRANLSNPSVLARRVEGLMADRFLETAQDLKNLSDRGDLRARAQLSALVSRLEPGMRLVRLDRTREAQEWTRRTNTDYHFLLLFTHWWDGANTP